MPHEIAHLAQPRGQLDVRPRGRRIARRVVVAEDDGGGRAPDERAEDVARVDLDAGERAAREAELALHAVAHVERDAPRTPRRAGARGGAEIRPDLGRAGQPLAARRARRRPRAARARAPPHHGRRAPGPIAGEAAQLEGGGAQRAPPSAARRRAGPPPRPPARSRRACPAPSTMASSSPSVRCSAPTRGQALARAGVRVQGRDQRSCRPSSQRVVPRGAHGPRNALRTCVTAQHFTQRHKLALDFAGGRASLYFDARASRHSSAPAFGIGPGRGF